MKVYTEFIKKKHVGDISPNILKNANQNGGVIVATLEGFYKVEKVELPDGHEWDEIIEDEAETL